MRNYLQHGDRHRIGGTDPTPGMSTLPTAVGEAAETTVGSGSTLDLSWETVQISDPSVFSWTSGTNIDVLLPGVYMTWLMIAADSAWPALPTHYVRWAVTVSSSEFGLGGLQPFGAHPLIDAFAPTGHEAGELVGSMVFHDVTGAPEFFVGHVDNTQNTSSFALNSPQYAVITRLCDSMTLI